MARNSSLVLLKIHSKGLQGTQPGLSGQQPDSRYQLSLSVTFAFGVTKSLTESTWRQKGLSALGVSYQCREGMAEFIAPGICGEGSCHTGGSGTRDLSPEPETNIAFKPASSDSLLPARWHVIKVPSTSQGLRVHVLEPVGGHFRLTS